jgi:hypothetical protein
MSYQVAEKITGEITSRRAGRNVEWAPANREYVIWPDGIPTSNAAACRRKIAELEAAEAQYI